MSATYQIHPAAELFPRLRGREFEELAESIRRDGLKVPIVLFGDTVIDGRNRLAACESVGVKPTFVQWTPAGEESPWDYVWSLNATRRHLEPGQRAVLAIKAARASDDWRKEHAKRRSESEAKRRAAIAEAQKGNDNAAKVKAPEKTDRVSRDTRSVPPKPEWERVSLASRADVSPATAARALEIERKAPDLMEKVGAGEVSLGKAIRKVKSRERQAEAKAAIESVASSGDDSFRVFVGDIRKNDHGIERNSIGAIITDPPYPKEYLPLYDDLGRFGAEVLSDGGSLFAMVGQSYLPSVIASLSRHLTYHWTFAYLTPGGQSVQLWDRKVNTFWKPVLWFVKGSYAGGWKGDVVKSAVNDNDKTFHEWGQSESGLLSLVGLAEQSSVVVDPFLGAGSTGVACLLTGRKFIGFDIDSKHVDTARGRLSAAVAKLGAA